MREPRRTRARAVQLTLTTENRVRIKSIAVAAALIGLSLLIGCSTGSDDDKESSDGKSRITSARALSAHYVRLTLSDPLGSLASDPSSYLIRDNGGAVLAVTSALVNSSGTEVTLTTASQQPTEYELTLAMNLGIGAAGFVGSSDREPFLESALSLSDTTVQLTFSEQLDKQLAETSRLYRMFDPDTDRDVDITITRAVLNDDLRTVVLTTTPQENRLYTVQVTGIKSRFSCDDGEVSGLTSSGGSGAVCASALRPKTADGAEARLEITARTGVDRMMNANAEAPGTVGSVQTSASGAGVGTAACGGSPCSSASGGAANEELTLSFDVPTRADTVVLDLSGLGQANVIVFLSSAAAPGYDLSITTAQVEAVSVGDGSELHLAEIDALPANLMIDRVRVRATAGASCLTSVCVRDGRTVDPTRNLANFYGTPAADTVAPTLTSVVSVSNTTILLTFSEPVRPESADPANFTISPALTVISAVLTEQQNQILLTTAPQQADVVYTVTVTGVKDKAGNVIATGGRTGIFVYTGAPENADASTAPRVVGAASTSNTTVVVTFNKAMSADAEVVSNYAIVQQNVNAEVGTVWVTDAMFLGTDRTAVLLTTRPQNEVTYMVMVTNVRDRFGNQLAPKELQAGVVIDPRSATFAGTPWSCTLQCSNGHAGLGDGYCGEDDDCTSAPTCAAGATCDGACEPSCESPDPDEDGLSDFDEQRGWVVHVVLATGETFDRQVTSSPDFEDTDGDGLSDATERAISTDPRDVDTDDDLINDYDEYNVIYSDATRQDTDGDSLDDLLEVEWYKTNALVADSDGDGFTDDNEIFTSDRSARIADMPEHSFEIGNVRLALDHRFTYVDAEGNTQSETISSSSALQQATSNGQSDLSQTVGHWLLGAEFGLDTCQSDCTHIDWVGFVNRLKFLVNVSGGQEFTSAHTEESSRATSSAYEQAMARGNELSASSERSREVVGASISVDVTFENPSDVAITLRNIEIRASTTDPSDPTHIVPIATLVAESTIITGEPLVVNLGPGQKRGAIVFTNRDVFPSMIDDLMRSPRGIVFNIANFDLETGDARNFATGLQTIRERTVGIRIDKGDGAAKQLRAITSGALNRSRDDLRCSETGTRPGAICSTDADCLDSAPCVGGTIVGGFSQFDGVSGTTALPLDFVLQDTLGMRKNTPAVLIAGGTTAGTIVLRGDDVRVPPPAAPAAQRGLIVVAPGRDGILQTPPQGTNYASEGMRLLAGDNGTADSTAIGDDVQVIAAGTFPLAPRAVVLAAGANGVIDSMIGADDVLIGPDGIRAGEDGAVQSFARGDDVQLIPAGTRGVPEDALAISGGENGVLDTLTRGDDTMDVVTGYEVSRTCSGDTPYRILRGVNGAVDTVIEDGVCRVAYAPHYVGEECSTDADCGVDVDSNAIGRCAGDSPRLTTDPAEVAVRPSVEGTFLDSVPMGDDVFVGPGIPCTVNADCTVGAFAGTCDGTQQVVRVEERRRGQYRRVWALLMSDDTQFQTDFGSIVVRPGDELSLAFVQDIDRDGLTAQTEYLYGSSDYRPDTDDDELSDFAEVRVGWDIGVDGQPLRRVFPDPRRKDTDGDGLTDLEELDLRPTRCACDARGPKTLLGSGNLLSGTPLSDPERGQKCNSDVDCDDDAVLGCQDAMACRLNPDGVTYDCPDCPSDVTIYRTDARQPDTDGDLVSDHEEVFGYLTGAGIIDPQQRAGVAQKRVVLAGTDRRADTVACPTNHCIDDASEHCSTDGDCVSRVCVHTVRCDDVQVVPAGTRVGDPRTVVAILGASGVAALTDVVEPPVTAAVSGSRLGGDDVLIAGLGQSVIDRSVPSAQVCEDGGAFLFCSAIKPGANGIIESVVGGNDGLIAGGTGQRLETSDPLRADSDFDLYSDGAERLLGSSPNVQGDAVFGGDLDEDGLTDSLERLGTDVSVVTTTILAASRINEVTVSLQESEVLLPDTDFDGLPDYAERNMPCSSAPVCLSAAGATPGNLCSNTGESCAVNADCACTTSACACPTNPNNPDTDGDGLSDLDELSSAQLEQLDTYNDLFPGYVLDIADSAALATDPGRSDADGDGLSDHFELYEGWIVLRADGSVSQVFSNPRVADSDGDQLSDGAEYGSVTTPRRTDPNDPDTDDDGRIDGLEQFSNPLRPDMSVTVTYSVMNITPPGGEVPAEWVWAFHVQGPGQPFPGSRVSNQLDCPSAVVGGCYCPTQLNDIILNKSVSLTLAPGEAFVLNGAVFDGYEDPGRTCPGGQLNAYLPNHDQHDGHYMSFVEQPVTYESLVSRQFTSRTINFNANESNGMTASVLVEIFVNCEGSARGLCRAGNRCLSDQDCESSVCDPTARICVDYCGNGAEDGLEDCDDGNHQACGTCNASCNGPTTPPEPCPTGVQCNSPSVCASNSCVGGRCAPTCGDGVRDVGELCDDRNRDACGTCNATCSGPGTGKTCAATVGCVTSNDCLGTCGTSTSDTPGVCIGGAAPTP